MGCLGMNWGIKREKVKRNWRNLHKDELHGFYFSASNFSMKKSNRAYG
jgi:hypothetical protein